MGGRKLYEDPEGYVRICSSRVGLLRRLSWRPVFFDSMGAKCSCVLVKTPDVSLLIDPGAAEMQPSFPLSPRMKTKYLREAHRALERAAGEADLVVVSHYHYDHHSLLDTRGMRARRLYEGKILYAKDPNRYVNRSQWSRARLFFSQLYKEFGGRVLEEVLEEPRAIEYPDPMVELPLASKKDWGDYAGRKGELLEKGRVWFKKLVRELWRGRGWVPELSFRDREVRWAEGREVVVGETRIRFSRPRFHGLEFDRVGWVCSTVVEYGGEKFLHTSDLEGVQLEDYRDALIEEGADVLVIDGPPTYLYGFIVNRRNLNRAVENLTQIVLEAPTPLIILDHHLPREPRYLERLAKVYRMAEKEGKRVITAAEYLGRKPKILENL